MTPQSTDRSRLFLFGSLLLGVFTFAVVLLFHNLADGDLWAKLALGSSVWTQGKLPSTDVFAFTPVLPVYVDHEWGSGLIFFTALKWFGPSGLMWLKVFLAFSALGCAFAIGARAKVSWAVLLALALPCAFCVLPGYVPVIRSHAFTYALFGLTLLLLELIRDGRRWPAFALVPVMVLWVNVHGGFVAGLGTIGVYAAVSVIERKGMAVLLPAFAACALATLVNPYGYKYWGYVLPAVFHKRPDIAEWQPMPWWGADSFLGFRILFVLTIVALIVGRRTTIRSWAGLGMVFITVCLALKSRRHAPFFGVAVLAFAGPYFASAFAAVARAARMKWWPGFGPARAVFALHLLVALVVMNSLLSGASFHPLAPVGQFPVREADILARAGLSGNLAVPFHWGSYASWRLYPKIKVSMDGRYEAAYPESSYEMNRDFFAKRGTDWDRLLQRHEVDFIMLELSSPGLRPEDLTGRDFVTVWAQPGVSALLVRPRHASALQKIVAELPAETIEPLDPSIPAVWPRF